MDPTVRIICDWCGKEFDKRKAEYDRQVRNDKTLFFCCQSHSSYYHSSCRPLGTSPSALCRQARNVWIKIHSSEPLCEICGDVADVHHKDGDRRNNSLENLRTLCRSHHISLENKRNPKRKKGERGPT